MTLSEVKARSLVLSFLQITQDFTKAKMCAEIAANLVLEEVENELIGEPELDRLQFIYQNVKTEIEKL